jgi:dethiobiotin synthetase
LILAAAGNVPLPYAWLNPYCLERATAPHLAAAAAAASIDIATIMRAFVSIRSLSDVIIVESAGGWLAPIGDPVAVGTAGPTMQEVAQALGLPVILVVGMRLGCISHALLTVDAIRRAGLQLAGWVANPIDPGFADLALYVVSLQRRIAAPLLQVPAAPELNAP